MKIKIVILLILFSMIVSCKNDNDKNNSVSIPDDPTLEQINFLLQKNPEDIDLLRERAKYLYQMGKMDEAISDMKKVIEKDSAEAQNYHLLADMYLDNAQSRYSIRTMEKVISLYPERTESLLKLSEIYFIVKQYDKSIATINSILYFKPNNPEAYFMLGVNFKEMKQLAKAKNSFLTAVENDPEHIDAWLELGQIAEVQNDTMAITYYKNVLLVDSTNIEAFHHLAYYYQNHNEIPKALDIYRKIINLKPDYNPAYLNTGLIYLNQDSLKQAFDNFNIMVNIDKTNYRAYYFRGLVHYLNHESNKAKADFEQALRINPDYIEAKDMLKKLKE